MPKKDTRKRIINPKTGRNVLENGSIGKNIRKSMKKKSTKKKNKIKKTTTKNTRKKTSTKNTRKKTKTTTKTKKLPNKKIRKSRGLANLINRIEGRKVMKVSPKGNLRLSAAQAFRDGMRLGAKHCYDGKCKTLKKDKNGRKFWG